jgi:hypothetical protein
MFFFWSKIFAYFDKEIQEILDKHVFSFLL